MPKGAVRKRCVDCRRTYTGDRDRAQWCPNCGGEMRPAYHAAKTKARPRG